MQTEIPLLYATKYLAIPSPISSIVKVNSMLMYVPHMQLMLNVLSLVRMVCVQPLRELIDVSVILGTCWRRTHVSVS